jgi:ribonuclease T1
MARVTTKGKLALAASLVVLGFVLPVLVQARQTSAEVATVKLADLPQQGRETYGLIHQGGPFPFQRDGSVFGNRERILPLQKRGYYLEYTVSTPGASTRGARRMVCGGLPKTPDACYYSGDHYVSFRKVVQ